MSSGIAKQGYCTVVNQDCRLLMASGQKNGAVAMRRKIAAALFVASRWEDGTVTTHFQIAAPVGKTKPALQGVGGVAGC